MSAAFEVETVYRVRVDYDGPSERETGFTAAVDRAARAKRHARVHVDDSNGGPCWNGYYVIESESRAAVVRFAERVVTLARVHKVRIMRPDGTWPPVIA